MKQYYVYVLRAGKWFYIGHAKSTYDRLSYHRRDIKVGLVPRKKNVKPSGKDPEIWSNALKDHPDPNDWSLEKIQWFDSKTEALRAEEILTCKSIDDPNCLNNGIGQKSGRLHRERASRSLTGSTKPKHWREAMTGEGNPFYGKTHSEEAMRKMREARARRKAQEALKHSAD